MPNFRYRAITQSGEVVNGSLSAPTAAEVARRIEYLGLMPIETVADEGAAAVSRVTFALFNQPRAADVTLFTRDLALLLKAGARLDDALELLSSDTDIGRLHPIVGKIRAGILAGESFAEAIGKHPALFPPIYTALVQVGETSGKLTHILELLAAERARAEALRRKLTDALQYPAFVLLAAGGVLTFFILYVLPQFGSVLRDFGAKSDSAINTFLNFSDFLRGNATEIMIAVVALIVGAWLLLRRKNVRTAIISEMSRLPGISTIFTFYRTALFCRNLGILLSSDVTLTATLRILVDIMAVTENRSPTATADRVRHGASYRTHSRRCNVAAYGNCMLNHEELARCPPCAHRRVYEVKLQRSLDRVWARRPARHYHHQCRRRRSYCRDDRPPSITQVVG
jgi:general secretion pathway protein F